MAGSVRSGAVPAVRAALVGGAAAGILAGGLMFAAPALADVTVTPAQAYRGDAARLTFRVPDERAGAYTTKVELRLPESTPIAEVYPMSVPDWGPSTTTRSLDQPLRGVHHGTVTDVTSTVTWVRTAPPATPGVAELVLSLGPMPEAEWLVFDVTQTYSDGTQVRWNTLPGAAVAGASPAPVVALAAPPAPAPADPGAGPEATAQDEPATDGFSDVLRVGLLIVLLVTAALAGAAIARRRQPATLNADPEPEPAEADEPDAPADPTSEPRLRPASTAPEAGSDPQPIPHPETDRDPQATPHPETVAPTPEPASATRWRLRP
ncbi:DUF1775 domain-containing protein [Micromonospora sp. NPDC050397]|uniref:DUF1775 domain-containing protein n=1 Tax=Micromonospora sp. NPDC050397 TaxID=3364279 RepID=UPI0038509C72